jgi:hypothetical protein
LGGREGVWGEFNAKSPFRVIGVHNLFWGGPPPSPPPLWGCAGRAQGVSPRVGATPTRRGIGGFHAAAAAVLGSAGAEACLCRAPGTSCRSARPSEQPGSNPPTARTPASPSTGGENKYAPPEAYEKVMFRGMGVPKPYKFIWFRDTQVRTCFHPLYGLHPPRAETREHPMKFLGLRPSAADPWGRGYFPPRPTTPRGPPPGTPPEPNTHHLQHACPVVGGFAAK